MKKEIKHSWHYPHPPARVWEYLTQSDLLAQWLMPNNFVLELGREFQFRIRPLPQFEFDGIVYCKVLAIEPLKKLSYSWKGGPGPGKINLDSLVEWTLEENDQGTALHLVHSGFNDDVNLGIFTSMDQGWLKNMKEIEQLIQSTIHGHNPA